MEADEARDVDGGDLLIFCSKIDDDKTPVDRTTGSRGIEVIVAWDCMLRGFGTFYFYISRILNKCCYGLFLIDLKFFISVAKLYYFSLNLIFRLVLLLNFMFLLTYVKLTVLRFFF